jgi:hypothetical protein
MKRQKPARSDAPSTTMKRTASITADEYTLVRPPSNAKAKTLTGSGHRCVVEHSARQPLGTGIFSDRDRLP